MDWVNINEKKTGGFAVFRPIPSKTSEYKSINKLYVHQNGTIETYN